MPTLVGRGTKLHAYPEYRSSERGETFVVKHHVKNSGIIWTENEISRHVFCAKL